MRTQNRREAAKIDEFHEFFVLTVGHEVKGKGQFPVEDLDLLSFLLEGL